MQQGTYDYLAQDRIIFGRPAAEAIREEAERLAADRVFLVSSRTLNRETDVVAGIREMLGDRYVGTFDACPAHTPRRCGRPSRTSSSPSAAVPRSTRSKWF